MPKYQADGALGESSHSPVVLTQTDTTVGFVSQDADRLNHIKSRPPAKQYIRALDSLLRLSQHTRVPQRHKNRVRRASRSTFVFPDGFAYRVIKDPSHKILIGELGGWAYTTSANRSGEPYDEAWARAVSDRVAGPLSTDRAPSSIYKISKRKIRKLR